MQTLSTQVTDSVNFAGLLPRAIRGGVRDMMRGLALSLVVLRIPVLVTTILVLGGCATKSDIRDLQVELQAELRVLAERQAALIEQLQTEANSTRDTLRSQSIQLFDFRGELSQQLREIGEGLATLEVLAGENQRAITGIRGQVTNLRSGSITPTATVLDSTDMIGGATGGGADQLYRTAAEQFGRGSLNTARMAFQQFVESHPNHVLAPEAHFSLADILYQQEDFDAALEAFGEIQSRFPTAAKVPDALYRIALIQIEMEEIESAIDTLQRITNTYPESVIAEIAADKLEEIGS